MGEEEPKLSRLYALARYGLDDDQIAAEEGYDSEDFKRMKLKDHRIADVMSVARAAGISKVMGALVKAQQEGSLRAVRYLLKHQGKLALLVKPARSASRDSEEREEALRHFREYARFVKQRRTDR